MTVRKYPILLIILFQCYGLIQSVILPLEIEGGCGVAHKETKLQCSDITAANPQDVDWIGPPNGLSLLKSDGAPIDPIKHAVTIQTNAFFLIINDTDASDVGDYKCEHLFDASLPFSFTQDKIEALECTGAVTDQQIDITIDYRPHTTNPQVTVKDKDGKDVPGTFVDDSTVTGLVKRIVWKTTSTTLDGGDYKYTVVKTGTCSLINDCSDTLTVAGSPVTTASTTPDTITATSATTASDPPGNDTRNDHDITIIAAVCGSLGGIIVITGCVIFCCYWKRKTRKQTKHTNGGSHHNQATQREHIENNFLYNIPDGHVYSVNNNQGRKPNVENPNHLVHPRGGGRTNAAPYPYSSRDMGSRAHPRSNQMYPPVYTVGGHYEDVPNVTYYKGKRQRH